MEFSRYNFQIHIFQWRPLQTSMTSRLTVVSCTTLVHIIVTLRNQSPTTSSSHLDRYDFCMVPSTVECSTCYQRQCDPYAPWPNASRDDQILLNGSQDIHPTLLRTTGPLSSAISSLALGVDSSPLSESSCTAFISGGGQFSGSPASNSPVANLFPCSRSHEDRQHR